MILELLAKQLDGRLSTVDVRGRHAEVINEHNSSFA
jgi:hypothetical protein